MKTTIYGYNFHLPDDKEAYKSLQSKLKATPGRAKLFNCIGTRHFIPNGPTIVDLDDKFINSNQWNATPGGRVFDWYEDINPNNRNHKIGHYLDITDQMIAVRQNTYVCGYCGEHYSSSKSHCTACLGSEYLKESDLNLLQLVPAAVANPKRRLSPEVLAELKQQWRVAQAATDAGKQIKFLNSVKEEHAKTLKSANIELDGYHRMVAVDLPASKAIFYKHTNTFCFGWQSPLDREVAESFLKRLRATKFPYKVVCKLADGDLAYAGLT